MGRCGTNSAALALCLGAGLTLSVTQEPGTQEPGTADLDAWLARLAQDGRTVRLDDVRGLTCAECHLDVLEEWRHSAHATAWQDEHYRAELRKVRRKQKCWGCHVPPPMVPAGLPQHPEPRADGRHLGVDCSACHLAGDGETILGPWGEATDAHPTERSVLMTEEGQNALCVACHATSIGPVIGIAKDFADTDQAGLDQSCVGCHMPGLRGPIANHPAGQDSAGKPPYPARERRSHRLQTPRDPDFLATAFDLELRELEGRTLLVIMNTAGHRVPGTTRRKLTFIARLYDDDGDLVAEDEHVIDHRRYLPVDENVELELDGLGARLELEGRHETDGLRRYQVFLERTLRP